MSESNIPSYLQAYMSNNAGANSDADTLTQVKTSVPRISLKGKRFKFINGEEESKSVDKIEVVILAVEPQGHLMAKTFYKSGYNPSDSSPPDCASQNGITPDAWIEDPVSERCASCPNNAFGSATSMSGKKAKACKDSKTLWVAKPDKVEEVVYGLKVPVTSLKAMSEFGQQVKSDGVPLAAVVVQLTMDPENEYPLLQFEKLGFLNEQNGSKAIERSVSREWIKATQAQEAIEYKQQVKGITTGYKPDAEKAVNATDIEGEATKVSQSDAASISKGW